MRVPSLARWVLGFGGGLVLLVAGVVGLAVWIEDRFPSEDEERALLARAQRALTRPVVDAIGRRIDDIVRRRMRMMHADSGTTVEEAIARFLDDTIDPSERRALAYRLAAVASPECIAALRQVLETGAPEQRAFLAQLIGSTGTPAAREWLWPLLDDPDERVVVGAIQGLSAIHGRDITARLAGILTDRRYSDRIRIETAAGLGTRRTGTARDALVRALGATSEGELGAQILTSLGHFNFSTVARTFRTVLDAPETPSGMRVVAVEALAHSSPRAVPFLLQLARGDASADVRASAAWAISAHETVGHLGTTLAGLVEHEPEQDVRRRLYEALLPQARIPARRLLPIVMAEQDVAARVAGFNAIGRGAHLRPASASARHFDAAIVPELVHIATTPNGVNIQMRAVFALRRARTPAARAALAEIAERAGPQVATAARNGLRATSS